MDRQKVDELPKMQVGFFETTGIPVFKVGFSSLAIHIQDLLPGFTWLPMIARKSVSFLCCSFSCTLNG